MKNWKYLLCAVLFCGMHLMLQAQHSLLEKYDFAQGGYTLLVIDHRPDYLDFEEGFNNGFDIPPDPDAPVYYDELQTMHAIQSKLTFVQGDIVTHDYCYSDKTIQICKEGKEVGRLGYSAKCSSVLADTTDYYFLGSFDFEGSKPVKVRIDDFTDTKRAHVILDSIRRSPDLIWLDEPDWGQFEGYFSFNVGVGQQSEQQCKDSVITDFAILFPSEPMQVSIMLDDFSDDFFVGEVVPKYSVLVKCNSSLWRKFGQNGAGLPEWKAYPMVLASYWK